MRRLSFVLFVACSYSLSAQTVLDNNPTSLKWYQINTPHFKVVFPKGVELQAQRMANTLEAIHAPEARTIGTKPRKISIVLQNQSSVSNAFVSITPRRSEFYMMPSQNYNFQGTNDWLNLLASHEYRHVVQFQHANRGFNRALYYLFGSNTLSAMAHVAAPQWFWEGDAVATETAFTPSGRGRIPNFSLLFKTNLMEGREFNYHKQYLRSYKNNIPDHYVLGYHLVSYLRERTGDPEIWGKITGRSWNVPFIPFAFSNAIKKETGLYVKDLYKEMVIDLKKDWKQEIDKLQLTSFQQVNPRTAKAYTDYLYPQPLEDGSVLAMKKGIGDIECFVILKDGEERKGFTPGFMNGTGMLSTANSKVIWNEYGYDPRWGVRNYSLIKAFDFGSHKKSVISLKHGRYAGTSLSPDGNKVASIRTNNEYQTALLLLDFSNGEILKEFSNPENYFYSMPRWSDDGRKIVVLKTSPEGRTVTVVDVETGTLVDLLPTSQENIGYPMMMGNYLFYNSPISGIDNIYVLDVQSNKKYLVTSSKYGAYNPAISKDGKTIYYNEQTRNGLDVVKITFDPSVWKPVENLVVESNSLVQNLVEQEGRPNLFDSISQEKHSVTKYSKLKGIVNPYSWGGYIDNSLTKASIGISSQDILSTTTINLGYQYDISEKTSSWKAGLSYQALFPIIDISFSQADRSVNEGNIQYDKVIGNDTTTVTENLTFDWKEKTVEAGLRIPLVTTSSKFAGDFTVSNFVGYTSITGFTNSIDGGGRLLPTNYPQYFFRDYADNGKLLYNHFSISAYRLLKKSRRDINSQWGQAAFVNIYNTPYGGDFTGNQFSFYGLAYFPGAFKHHSIYGYWGFQNTLMEEVDLDTGKGLDNYTFRNQIPLPRGQSISRFQKFYSMSVNYTLPICYPDISIGPLLNIQRVRANAFLDYGFGSSQFSSGSVSQSYSSVGAEVKFDINVMRFLPQFDIGVRYSKGINPSASKFEILIGSINF